MKTEFLCCVRLILSALCIYIFFTRAIKSPQTKPSPYLSALCHTACRSPFFRGRNLCTGSNSWSSAAMSSWPLSTRQTMKTTYESQEVHLHKSSWSFMVVCLTLVIDGVGHDWAETVFSAVIPLELTLKTQTHCVHVHVFNALWVTSWGTKRHKLIMRSFFESQWNISTSFKCREMTITSVC